MPLTLCTITGTVYDVRGNVAPGVTIYVLRLVKSGAIISDERDLVATSAVDGTVSFSLPRASTAYLYADVTIVFVPLPMVLLSCHVCIWIGFPGVNPSSVCWACP